MKNISKAELIKQSASISNNDIETVNIVMDAFLSIVKEEISNGRKITIQGFGVFDPKENRRRNGVNPSTGESIIIEASKSIRFRPSKNFRDLLN